jgi:hypothetical protein
MEAGSNRTRRFGVAGQPARRLTTETKHAFKTTEFWVYIGFLLLVLIAGTVDNAEGSEFGAEDVWLFATIVTGCYLLSRGLSKSGSRDPYWDTPGDTDGNGIADRVKAAAQVLTDGPDAHRDGPDAETTRIGGRSSGPAA